LKTTLISSKE